MTAPATLTPNLPYALHRDDAPAFWLVGILWQVLATGAQTGSRYSLIEEVCKAGSGPPTHTHTQDEGFYVIDGECTFNAGGETLKATAGTFVHVPRETGHSFSVDADDSRLLNFYIPAGFEFILMSIAAPAQELRSPAVDAVPMPPARIVEQLSRDYGQTKVLGLPFVDPPSPELMITEPSSTAPTTPFRASREDAPAYWGQGILWNVLATGEQTAGAYSVIEELCPRDSGPPPHAHDQDECFYLLEGQATFLIGKEQRTVEAGGFVWVPAGTTHGFRVDSDSCRLLNVYSPAGFERTIPLTGLVADQRTLPPSTHQDPEIDPERLRQIFEEVGMRAVAGSDPLRPVG